MRIEDIEKAASDKSKSFGLNFERSINFEQGFVWGAKWYIDNIWHDASEEPKNGRLLLINLFDDSYELCYWGDIEDESTIKKWCYIEDLLLIRGLNK